MHALGKRIGAQCVAGDLILLNGPVGAGTGHCYYTSAQWLAAAKMVAGAVNTGKFPNQGPIVTAAKKVGLSYDNKFRVPTFKSLS